MARPASLSRDVILEAAEAVVAREGWDALTMRSLARELGVVPMAAYTHFPNKDALLDALLDRVLGAFALDDDPTAAPAERLEAFARAHQAVLAARPDAVPRLFTRPNPGPEAVRIAETAMAVFGDVGLGESGAIDAFVALIAFNYGWASFVAGAGMTDEERAIYAAPARYDAGLRALILGLTTANSVS